jgi:hypothetical protein
MKTKTLSLEEQLNHFDFETRLAGLRELAALPEDEGNGGHAGLINMHMHSFFSYNAYGWSPARLVWEAHKAGLHAAGLVDFDVLDGLEEFLGACRKLQMRGAVGLETRAFLAELADKEISSPGEPGVAYIMGMGFPYLPVKGSESARMLASFRLQYDERNETMIARINAALPEIALDYKNEAKPLTPAGGVTERHIVRAYREKAERVFKGAPEKGLAFWCGVLGKDQDSMIALQANIPAFEEAIRSKLTKKGGIGYEAPSDKTFPPVDTFIKWVASNKAIPMAAWLDGTSTGEADPGFLLECQASKGASALNIIPDRNWNIKDPVQQEIKVRNLAAIIKVANGLQMPINIGTEMNKDGLPYADNLAGPVLKQYAELFLEGANVMVGQTLLARYAACAFASPEAEGAFGNRAKQIKAFARIGAAPALGEADEESLVNASPDQALAILMDRSK